MDGEILHKNVVHGNLQQCKSLLCMREDSGINLTTNCLIGKIMDLVQTLIQLSVAVLIVSGNVPPPLVCRAIFMSIHWDIIIDNDGLPSGVLTCMINYTHSVMPYIFRMFTLRDLSSHLLFDWFYMKFTASLTTTIYCSCQV